jgi:uncharacterized membrane protein YdjX (TVP38/TMEM64 family)
MKIIKAYKRAASRLGWARVPIVIGAVLMLSWAALFSLEIDVIEGYLAGLPEVGPLWTFSLVVAVLGSDIILPVPSTLVNTLAGNVLGLWAGFFAITSGMTLCSLAGYAIGHFSGKAFSRKMLSSQESRRMACWGAKRSRWLVIVSKGLPLMNETVSITCGFAKMGFFKFLAYSLAGIIPVSFVYAYLGHIADSIEQLLFIICGGFLIALAIGYLVRKKLSIPKEANILKKDAVRAREDSLH